MTDGMRGKKISAEKYKTIYEDPDMRGSLIKDYRTRTEKHYITDSTQVIRLAKKETTYMMRKVREAAMHLNKYKRSQRHTVHDKKIRGEKLDRARLLKQSEKDLDDAKFLLERLEGLQKEYKGMPAREVAI